MDWVKQMGAERAGPANPEILTQEKISIPLRDGATTTHNVFRPVKPPAEGAPLVIFAFGGGFISGDEDQSIRLGRMVTTALNAVTVLISYRLAPEHKFPCAQLDAWDAVKWLAEHAGEIGADPRQGFVMTGISAGAQIASAVVTKAIEEPLAYPITGQYLGVPTILDAEHTPEKYKKYHLSIKHNANAPVLNAPAMDAISHFIEADPNSALRWPILSSAPLAKQPKAFFMVCGMDPLRDDGLIWDEILKDNGVETKCQFYPGCPHCHWGFFLGPEVSNQAIVDQLQGYAWLLGKELKTEEIVKLFIS